MSRKAVTALSLLLSVGTFLTVVLSGGDRPIAWVLATAALMAALWITEAIPIGATSLLPIAVFPLAGLADVKEVAPLYGSHIVFLFIAGFLLAFAMEKWSLHKRIAYKIIDTMGYAPKRILLGFIAAAFLLSMWINNTSTTIVLLAPALAIIKELNPKGHSSSWLGTALLLGICYTSSIGGIVTPIGTAPNLILISTYESNFPELPELSFFKFMQFALPIALVLTTLLYFFLASKIKGTLQEDTIARLKAEVHSLAKTSFEERAVLIAFLCLIVLWMTSKNLEIGSFTLPGWTSWFENPSYIKDSTVGMAVALLLFFIPAKNKKSNLLEWEDAKKLPFDILFIFGGGFSLAKGFQISGLDQLLAGYFEALSGLPIVLLVLAVCFLMTFLTEITSNTATTQLILPLLVIVAQATDIAPIYLLLPAAFSASFAFMLPVATPPNAIVFATGQVPTKVMMKTGIWLNLAGVVLLTLYTYFFASWLS